MPTCSCMHSAQAFTAMNPPLGGSCGLLGLKTSNLVHIMGRIYEGLHKDKSTSQFVSSIFLAISNTLLFNSSCVAVKQRAVTLFYNNDSYISDKLDNESTQLYFGLDLIITTSQVAQVACNPELIINYFLP